MAIVQLPLQPLSVTACAGSGKTKTAVRRLVEMRRLLDDNHGIVALLSFSNVAVDTFRRDYVALMRGSAAVRNAFAVEIDTVDGFITTNVLRPHSHRDMSCQRTPFLVDGREPFLKNFTVFDGARSNPTADLSVSMDGDTFKFQVGWKTPKDVTAAEAVKAITKLGKVGAYTHALARYWVLQTLKAQPFVLRALARRYPHILIDEAQDIGPEHQAILELMVGAGSQLSLIGDPNQGIYDFSGANGEFLSSYGQRPVVKAQQLNINYRSVPAILNVANKLSGRADTPNRAAPAKLHGAYYIPFKKAERDKALATFRSMMTSAGVDATEGVVVCRSRDWADEWSGAGDGQGQGIIRSFADATITRDKLKQFADAFKHACAGIFGLLDVKHQDLLSQMSRNPPRPENLALRRAIWSFVRDPETGLPSGTLLADTQWHPLMVARAKGLVTRLTSEFGLAAGDNLGQKLAKKALRNEPLILIPDLAQVNLPQFRVSTVHKVKGESLEAVMYVTNKAHVSALLEGTTTEVGRIGYVAVTRARNLFVLAVPENCLAEFEERLLEKGFQKPGV
ncbi:MAG: ATP-dependent helicase [Hyphomicrobium sp.]